MTKFHNTNLSGIIFVIFVFLLSSYLGYLLLRTDTHFHSKKLISLCNCRLTILNWLAPMRMVTHSDTHGHVQCSASWCMKGLHRENEARFKMFIKVQVKLVLT